MKLADRFKSNSLLFPKPGLYHYRFDSDNEKSRAHLRLDADGIGTLIVNANRIMHLNPTAALMAYLVLEKVEENWVDRLNLIATDNKCRMQQNYAHCRRLVAWFGEARKTATADVGGEDGERDSSSCSLPT